MTTLLLLLALAQTPAPRTFVVGPGAYPTLAAAVAAASAGDTVRVTAGRHRGTTVIDRAVVVVGEPGALLDGERRGTVVSVRADSVVLAGLGITGSGRSMNDDEAAIKLDHCTGCRILGVTITDPLHGIYLLESNGVEIADNEITGAADLVESARGNGIHLFNSAGNRLLRNRIRATRDGMYFSFASGNIVAGNDVARVRYGLHYMYSDDNRFEDNVFTENAAGAAIMFSKRIVFRANEFSRHVGYRAYGILLQTAEGVVAEHNRIEGNLTGLFLDGATADTFRANVIHGNGVGIDVLASAENNVFTGNVITGNRTAVRSVLGIGVNAWSARGRGNYWGGAEVFDLDGDGIGDRPYRAGDPYTLLAASRPALELFSGTIAAHALSWADEAFPVFDLPRVEDPRPLARRPAEPGAATEAPGRPAPASAASATTGALFAVAGAAGLFLARRRLRCRSSASLREAA